MSFFHAINDWGSMKSKSNIEMLYESAPETQQSLLVLLMRPHVESSFLRATFLTTLHVERMACRKAPAVSTALILES